MKTNINGSNTACRAGAAINYSNLQILNAILYATEHGCKWRGLPKRFDNWHTIYTRMNWWVKREVASQIWTAR